MTSSLFCLFVCLFYKKNVCPLDVSTFYAFKLINGAFYSVSKFAAHDLLEEKNSFSKVSAKEARIYYLTIYYEGLLDGAYWQFIHNFSLTHSLKIKTYLTPYATCPFALLFHLAQSQRFTRNSVQVCCPSSLNMKKSFSSPCAFLAHLPSIAALIEPKYILRHWIVWGN